MVICIYTRLADADVHVQQCETGPLLTLFLFTFMYLCVPTICVCIRFVWICTCVECRAFFTFFSRVFVVRWHKTPCLSDGFGINQCCIHIHTHRQHRLTVAAGTSGVSGVATRAVVAHDRGETAGRRTERSVQRGRGAEGTEEPFRTSQGARWEGKRPRLYHYNYRV